MCRAIIDIDTYLYKASLTCKSLCEMGNGRYQEIYDINIARQYLKDTCDELTLVSGCDEYIMVTGGVGTNFRKILNPEYKSNRKKQAKPIMLDLIRDMVFREFPIVYTPHLEADDTCRILLEEDKNNVVVSIDKDLRTFSGKIYDATHEKMRFITEEQADNNFKRQLLIGDKTDGYDGIPGIGNITADKLILSGITIDDIIQMYIDKGLGLDTFENVYNMAHILGKKDYDNGIIKLYGGKTLDVTDNKS